MRPPRDKRSNGNGNEAGARATPAFCGAPASERGLSTQHSPQGVAPGSGAASAFYPIEHFVRKPTRDSVVLVV